VVTICIPDHFVEKQAFFILEKMISSTIYKPVELHLNEGRKIPFECWESASQHSSMVLIKRVILEDKSGLQYPVELDLAGLQFASGEISYGEYQSIKRNDTKKSLFFLQYQLVSFLLLGC
jgi:hypothetical protein